MRANVKTYYPVVHPWKQNVRSGETKWELTENNDAFNLEIEMQKGSQERLKASQLTVSFLFIERFSIGRPRKIRSWSSLKSIRSCRNNFSRRYESWRRA